MLLLYPHVGNHLLTRDGCQDVPSPPENVSIAAAHGVVRSIFKCLPLRVASSRLMAVGDMHGPLCSGEQEC